MYVPYVLHEYVVGQNIAMVPHYGTHRTGIGGDSKAGDGLRPSLAGLGGGHGRKEREREKGKRERREKILTLRFLDGRRKHN